MSKPKPGKPRLEFPSGGQKHYTSMENFVFRSDMQVQPLLLID